MTLEIFRITPKQCRDGTFGLTRRIVFGGNRALGLDPATGQCSIPFLETNLVVLGIKDLEERRSKGGSSVS